MAEPRKNLSGLSPDKLRLLMGRLKEKDQAAAPRIGRAPRDGGPLPLSFAQERLWFLDRLEPGNAAYNVPAALRLDGGLSVPALAAVLREIARRHEVLRTTFGSAGGRPEQAVSEEPRFPLPLVDLSSLPSGRREALTRELAAAEAGRSFDLERGPVARAVLVRLAAHEHVALFTFHHIVFDAWSIGVLAGEVTALYKAFAAGRPSPLAAPPLQYADYAAWQREHLQGGAMDALLGFWRDRLKDLPAPLELPADRPRGGRFSGAVEPVALPDPLLAGLARLGAERGATIFMTLLAAFEVLLHRYTGREDFTLGTPIVNRDRAETAGLIGFFTNTLVLRAGLSGEPGFRELLAGVREHTLAAFAHQDLPFERLVEELAPERDLAHAPLFQILFTAQSANLPALDLGPGLSASHLETGAVTAKFEISLNLAPGDAGWTGALGYDASLFDRATVRRLAGHFRRLLEGIAADPDRRVSELPLLTEGERRQVLDDWNEAGPARAGRPVHAVFAEHAARAPEAVALVFEDRSLTFRELDERANRLAHRLRRLGVGPEARVGLCAEPSLGLIPALLGVLKSGGAYVPLDPGLPAERLAGMLEDCGARALVVQEELRDRFGEAGIPVVGMEDVLVDESAAAPESTAGSENLAYVVYTSGSTGRPKGVMVEHRQLAAYVAGVLARMELPPGSSFATVSTLAADLGNTSVFSALASGGALHVVSRDRLLNPGGLADVLGGRAVDCLKIVPSHLAALLGGERAGGVLPKKLLVTGGEACPGTLVQRVRELAPDCRVLNHYGPTETTVGVLTFPTWREEDQGGAVLPLGRPLPGTRVYAVDRNLQPLPAGLPGELLVGGPQVSRGYLGRPDLTAERFVPDPFAGEAGARLYRTGDLARRLPGGAVEFLGRIDQQVKVRGFRVEPGEVESVLAAQPGVRAAAVLVRPDGSGGNLLVAYIAGAVPAGLDRRLPAYMVPSAFVVLPELPLTPNGKIDRRALAAITPEAAPAVREHVPPRNAAEEALARVWAEVLGVGRVGVQDDFFALGGHSLLGIRLLSRVEEVFGVRLPVRALFQETTLGAMAERIAGSPAADGEGKPEAIGRVPRDGDPLPLSFAQERLWFLDLLAPGRAVYNVPSFVRLRGRLDGKALRRTLTEVTRRHESLRTTFGERDGVPFQVIAPPGGIALPLVELRGGEDEMLRLAHEEARRPFDLARGPLFRAALLRLAPEDHVLLLNIHHIVSDGWSRGVLIREVAALYDALSAGRPSPLPELPIQYADYAAWQRNRLRGETLETELAFWRQRLAGTPPLEVPADRPRPPRPSFRGGLLDLEVPGDVPGRLRVLCRTEEGTAYMALLAAFQTLLLRYSGQTDFAIGSPVANRVRAEVEGVIGFFVNTLALRVDLAGSPTFRQLLRRVKEAAVEAFSHEEMPFERIVEDLHPAREAGRNPVFQALLALQSQPWPELAMGGLEVSAIEVETGTAKVDLGLTWQERADRLHGTLEYSSDLFEAASAARLARHAVALLRGALEEPDRTLWDLPMLSQEERRQLVTGCNEAPTEAWGPDILHARFAAQAARSPAAVAVVCDGERWTYGDLDRRANQVANHLIGLGVLPGDLVGLRLERSLEMVAAILGVLKAGAAYVPLDPEYPAERLDFMIADSRVSILLTRESLADIGGDSSDPGIPVSAQHPAYVIYTSGSTGRPKGVVVRHGNAARLFTATDRWFGFGPEDVWTLFHSYAFDFSVWEIWGALLYGGRLVVVPYWVSRSPAAFYGLLRDERVTVLNQTPSAFRQLIQAEYGQPSDLALRYVIFGGEALEPAALAPWFERHGDERPRLINMYGITETTVHVTYREVRAGDTASAVGRPIRDLGVYLLDRALNLVPAGVPGEMFVGGAGLALGYLNRPELTAERFIPNPFSGAGSRLYRSGDLARRLPDGDLEYLGRIDHQVKIRGFRIELGEIESALARHPAVREAVALVQDTRLVAFVVPAAETAAAAADLRGYLAAALPAYMVPAAFTWLESLPLTPNGKVDRQALARTAAQAAPAVQSYVPPRNGVEELLATVWEEVLEVPRVGAEDDFFSLGGHSLLAVRLISKVDDLFAVQLPVRDVFHASTLSAMAERIAEELAVLLEAGAQDRERIAPAPRGGDPLPLSFAQERLWFLDRFAPGNAAYHMPAAVRLAGRLDVPALRGTLTELARRHEPLRTTCGERDGVPFQRIVPASEIPVPLVDLSALSAAARERESGRLILREARHPFDLATGPLFRAALLRLTGDGHVLLLTAHHIVSDGWSLGVLIRETAALYGALAEGRPSPLPELSVQYADYAVWQRGRLRGEALATELAFWRQRLAGVPALELPADRRRPQQPSLRGGRRKLAVPGDLPDRLRAFCRQEGVTSFMTLLASFQTFLLRYSGQTDFAVGSPVANRNRSELEGIVGLFVNTLALRVDLSGGPTFRELARRVRKVALAALAHEEMPFERIVSDLHPERDPGRNPLFQVMLSLQSQPWPDLTMGGLEVSAIEVETGTAKVDLGLTWQEKADRLLGTLEYSSGLFEATSAARMARHAVALLRGALEAPDRTLWDLPMLSPEERRQLVVDWNGVSQLHAPEHTADRLIAAQAARTPGNPALISEDGAVVTYGELDHLSDRLALRLRRLGVGPEVPVGVYLQRSVGLVVSLLAIWKAGGVHLPLDPAYPAERLGFMLEDSGARAVITLERLAPSLPATGARTLILDAPAEDVAGMAPAGAYPRNLSYILYTSGSTGRPKAVGVEHEAAVRHFRTVVEAWELTAEDRVLMLHSPSFDPWFEETVVPLLCGAAVAICGPELWEPARLLVQAAGMGVTVMPLPTTLWDQWVRESALGPQPEHRVRMVSAGGEAMSGEVARLWWRSPLAAIRLLNAYGPTEAVVTVKFHAVSREAAEHAGTAVEIGSPCPGRTAYVLDREGGLLPPGVPGELFLGGQVLSRGYAGRPDLTAERYLPDPFAAERGGGPGGRLYRTGDLVRRRPDGNLEFLGRIDHQVKVRGFRIEMGEIEAALERHPAVGRAVVVDWKTPAGDSRLAAFVVPAGATAPTVAALREHLAAVLPAFMVPSAFTILEALPLTTSRKVDRQALAQVAPESVPAVQEYVPPRNDVEELLAPLWAEVLEVPRVGAEDDFFALGGHSLLAVRLTSKVDDLFGIRLPVRDLFHARTLSGMAHRIARELATLLAARCATETERIGRAPRNGGPLPLSSAQERLWFLDRFAPGSAVYNIPSAVRLAGPLDAKALRRMLDEMASRHESLRTTFGEREGVPFQRIAAALAVPLPLADLSALTEATRRREVSRLALEEARQPFDLSEGPLFRTALLRLAAEEHILLLTVHHIVSDGWSQGVLIHEMAAVYAALAAGRPSPLPELPIQYADYAVWQRERLQGEVLEAELAFWRQSLAGVPPLELPTDRPRPLEPSFRGGVLDLEAPAPVAGLLHGFCREEGVTAFMVLMAAFQTFILRYSGQADFAVGAPVANRDRSELEGIVGLFVNTLALRADLSGGPTFRELARRVREVILPAFSHGEMPFERIVLDLHPERDPSRNPLFQVMLALQNQPLPELAVGGLEMSVVKAGTGTAKVDLSLIWVERDGRLQGALEYSSDLFEDLTAGRMARHAVTLLQEALTRPDQRLSELAMLSPAERRQVVVAWNGAPEPDDPEETLDQLIVAQARRTPENAAVVHEDGATVTYRELDELSNRLARRLRLLGVGPDALVGACLESSTELVISLLAIWKAGGAFLPLDPSYPAERLAFMLRDAGARVVIARESFASSLPETGARIVSPAAHAEELPDGELPAAALPRSLAYAIYTSGTTGRPKAVGVDHQAALRHLRAVVASCALTERDRALQIHSPSFDPWLEGTVAPLLSGAAVVICGPEAWEPSRLLDCVSRLGVTLMDLPTSVWDLWVRETAGELSEHRLRGVIVGGEAMSGETARLWWRSPLSNIQLYNAYGPTEAVVTLQFHGVSREAAERAAAVAVEIGSPLSGRTAYVLDRDGSLLPPGVPGELCLGGQILGRGYLGRPGLTAEKFVPDPFAAEWGRRAGGRMYRTGDLVRRRSDGVLEFLGRIDHQVKVRGFRIELGEIEEALARHPAVRRAAAVAWKAPGGDTRLAAFVVPAAEPGTEVPDLRSWLGEVLPAFMVPAAFIRLESLPWTPGGKVDRLALARMAAEKATDDREHTPPDSPLEELLATLWEEVLGVSRVGAHDDFFALGGHSLLVVRLISRIDDLFGVRLPVRALFRATTLSGMAERIAEEMVAKAGGEMRQVPHSAAELQQLVVDWNGAPLRDAPQQALDRLVAAQAARTPERAAVVSEDGAVITYGELDRLSDRLALRLRRLGVGPDVPVGVLLHRSPELVISLLAIWKAGGAHLPLDPAYPGERLAFMLEDSGARVVITLEALKALLPGSGVPVLALDSLAEEVAGGEAPAGALPRALAYVLYTSGSTGRPKAVGVEHEGLGRHLRNIIASWELTAEDRVLMLHSPSFDPCFEDIVAPLLCGGAVVICGPEVWPPHRLLFRAAELGVTVMPLPTTLWDEWVRGTALAGQPGHRVRMVTAGGEAMSGEVARLWWRSPLSQIRLLNGYGPTETVIAMKYHDVDGAIAERTAGAVELGSPYPGRTAYVLDEDGGLLPAGSPGELCLGGQILGRGYIGRPALTAERFVPDPFAAEWGGEAGSRMYRTGDLARRRPDGILEFLGRIDHQVKVRGFRIELGEIEAALERHSAVGRAVVVTWKPPAGDARFAAFVVPALDPAPTAAELRAHLAAILPVFMVPSSFTVLESLPLTASHKVDRRALERRAAESPAAAEGYVAPRNVLEELLAPLWAEVLGVGRIGAHDDFFALGGHSLLALRLISKIDDVLGVRLPVGAMFHASTLGGMAERIAEELAAQAGDEFLRQISAEKEEYEESSHG